MTEGTGCEGPWCRGYLLSREIKSSARGPAQWDAFGMGVNDESAASRQFVAASPSMSSQMTAFATGKGRYGVQAAGFALILVMVMGFVTPRSHGMAIAAAGLVALSIFGLAGTAYVWWRSRRKVIIGVTSDGLTVNQRRDVFPFVDAKLAHG